MPVVRLDIEYDGSAFAGWATQPGMRAVQSELEMALATVLREAVRLSVAGRTDAGVHAIGQVASCEIASEPPADLRRSLNSLTARDLTVTQVRQAAAGFDARRSAHSRTYGYRLFTRRVPSPFEEGRALWHPYRLDREALDACASALPGVHDFSAFTPTKTDHVRFTRRVMRAAWVDEGPDLLVFRIEADSFMRNMVRALVGTMLEVASRRRSVAGFEELLRGAPRERGGETAPPHGLYLESVAYP